MPSPQPVLFLTDGLTRSRLHSSPRSAYIGIWWHFGPRLIAILERSQFRSMGMTLVDSSLNHADEWNHVINAAHEWTSGDPHREYFTVPRGRCLLNVVTGSGRIYHGNQTPPRMLRQIAKQFGFRKFDVKTDDHYLMGPAADRLFDEDFNPPE